jgi:hypothetical protein
LGLILLILKQIGLFLALPGLWFWVNRQWKIDIIRTGIFRNVA